MNSYKDIPLWENVWRCRVLVKFRENVISYFNNSSPLRLGEGRREETEAVQARQRINHTVIQAHHIIEAAGVPSSMSWAPPPMIGGHVREIDLFLNLFELDRYQISANSVVGLIEMALGVYQSDRTAALRRTSNPFWWLFRWLLWFARIPFVFLGAVGFDVARAEGSALGKFVKLVTATIMAIAALLTILNYLGWLPAAKALLRIE